MARFLRRITLVEMGDGAVSTQTLLKRKGGRKNRVSGWLRPVERVVRQYQKAHNRYWSESVRLHNKSRAKKGDRWLTDGMSNALQSLDKGCRVLRKI